MRISVGNDLVRIDRIASLTASGDLKQMLSPHEIQRSNPEHIAGLIALKEAAIKALGLNIGDWLNITVRYANDKPVIDLIDYPDSIESMDCSISHEGNYAAAVVVVLYR